MKAVRWGILGAARIGERVVSACRGSTLATFEAIAAREKDRAEKYAGRLGLKSAYGAYEELIGSDEIDAIYIATPNALHASWAKQAARAGKHVLSEKPFGRKPAEVQAAIEAATEAGTVLVEAFQWRYHPQTDLLRRLLRDGAIGLVRHVRATLTFALRGDLSGDVRGSGRLHGGALIDVGSCCVAGSRLCLGAPEWAFGAADKAGEVDVRFVGTLGFAGGPTAEFDCAMNLPRRDGLEIVGQEGVIRVSDPWHCRGSGLTLRRGNETNYIRASHEGLRGDIHDAYRLEMEAVSRAIGHGEPLTFGMDDVLNQADTLAALHQSAFARAPIPVREAHHADRRGKDPSPDSASAHPRGRVRIGP